MLTQMKTLALSAMIALGAFAAAPATAQAADVRVGIHIGHSGPGWGYGPRYGHRWHGYRAQCTPGKALNKASRMGMRRAFVNRVGPNRIVVKGVKNGHRATLAFGKAPNCPVRNWR